jgi:phosphoserine phosphatase RsbU/P
VEASSQAAGLLNGDYFDVVELDGGNLGIAVADASGKGTPAALLMSNIQATVRALAGQAPWDLCGTLNWSVHRNAARAKFATFFYGALDAARGRLTYANAGHCAPVLLRSNGEIERLYPTGTVLGLFPDAHYEPAAIKLATGDRLLLYSDGITEAENENDEQFGEERLCGIARSVRGGTAAEIRDRVFEAVGAFSKGPARDDATLVTIAAM